MKCHSECKECTGSENTKCSSCDDSQNKVLQLERDQSGTSHEATGQCVALTPDIATGKYISIFHS